MHISSQPLLEDIYSVAFGCSQKKVTEIVVSRMEKRERERAGKRSSNPRFFLTYAKAWKGGVKVGSSMPEKF